MAKCLWNQKAARSALGLVTLLAMTSCSGSPSGAAPSRRVVASDFASPGAPANLGEANVNTGTPVERSTQGASDVVVVMGAPMNPLGAGSPSTLVPTAQAATSSSAAAQTERLLVDQLVGQINGRPVFANEFFAPMDARLRRSANELRNRQGLSELEKQKEWLKETKQTIDAALWDKLRDQLLLAEFESSLTPEQKVGLFHYIESVRADLVSGNLGSEAQANQRLLESEQIDLDTKVADISRGVFIREQLRKAISTRVQVSYWDVQLYYDQRIDEFVPLPTARFIVIRAPISDEAKVSRIESALAEGEDFGKVAAAESAWRPNAGNLFEVTIKSRDYVSERYFGPEPLNAAALALSPGKSTDRIDVGGDAWWIMLAAIDQPEGRSLYDVQSEIELRLRAERWREEEIRYFDQLFQRGSFSDVKLMSGRLLQFAAERYLIQNRMDDVPIDAIESPTSGDVPPSSEGSEPSAGVR